MSDPVTNVEIEDVLSSIRRLVSNEARGPHPPEKTGDAPEPEVQKLVLTPSFRVDQDDDTPPAKTRQDGEAGEDRAQLDAMLRQAGQPDDHSADAPQEAHEPSEEATDDESDWDDVEEHEHAADHDAGAADERAEEGDDLGDEDAWDAAEADEASDDTAEEHVQDPEEMPDAPEEDAHGTALKARVAELEQVVAGRAEQWEPDGSAGDDYAGGPVDPLPWEDYVPSDTGGDADGLNQNDDAGEDAPDAQSSPEDGPQGLDEVAMDDAAEQDAPEDERFAAQEAPMPEGANSQDRLDGGGLADDPDAILDEEALRDLVAEIVREELQGALGERITRNVRKLVRREIHRALTSQELE